MPLRTNGFQDRLVMTTSIPLHVFLLLLYFSATMDSLAKDFVAVNTFFVKVFDNFLGTFLTPIWNQYFVRNDN